jgi:hypothetical protein
MIGLLQKQDVPRAKGQGIFKFSTQKLKVRLRSVFGVLIISYSENNCAKYLHELGCLVKKVGPVKH